MKILRYMMLVIMLLTCVIVSAQNKVEYLDGSRSFLIKFKYGRTDFNRYDRMNASIVFIPSDTYRGEGTFTVNINNEEECDIYVKNIKGAVIEGGLFYMGDLVYGKGVCIWNYDHFACVYGNDKSVDFTNTLKTWEK